MSLKIEQTIILFMIFLGYLGKYSCGYFQFINISNDKVSEYLTIVFGITSVIATLVGLVTIFASLSVQHKIDKSKEILWTLKDLHSDNLEYKSLDVHRQLVKLLRAYDYASSYEEQKSTNIISLAKSTLIIIYLIWIVIGFALIPWYTLFEFYSILLILIAVGVLLFCYYNYLEQLRDFRIMSELPSLQQMLDADYDKGLKGLFFASFLVSANLINCSENTGDCKKLLLTISLSPPIYNFTLLVEVNYYKDKFDEEGNKLPLSRKLITKNDYLRKISKKDNLGLDYSAQYKVAVIKPPIDDFDSLEIEFTMFSRQGMAKTNFVSISRENVQFKKGLLSFDSFNKCHFLERSKNNYFEERRVLLAKKDAIYLAYDEGTIKEFMRLLNEEMLKHTVT